ncbi:MAG: hypothetical protein AAGH71_02905 [Planctomycetota bacterium]
MFKRWMASRRVVLEERIAFLHKLRLRSFAIVLGLVLAAIGVISVVSAPAWSVVAGAVAIAAVAVNKVASRLAQPVCLGCGTAIGDEPVGQYGVVCPNCGTIAEPAAVSTVRLASGDNTDELDTGHAHTDRADIT